VGGGRHWSLFADWCVAAGRCALPSDAATVGAFLTEVPAGPATLERRLRAIDDVHRSAGVPAPGGGGTFDNLIGRRPTVPRFAPDQVASALGAIPVGGWPTGIVGQRDAAVVALICCTGLTRAQVQSLRVDTPPPGQHRLVGDQAGLAELLGKTPRSEDAGHCPRCALTRWLYMVVSVEHLGWRAVRGELADCGAVAAGDLERHTCELPTDWLVWQMPGSPLFWPIDRHGTPQTRWPISTRSLTTIVATRLAGAGADDAGGPDDPDPTLCRVPLREVSANGGGVERRRELDERFRLIEAALEEAEQRVEAVLARAQVVIGAAGPKRGASDRNASASQRFRPWE